MTKKHWLELIEILSIILTASGTIVTILTQQLLFVMTPLMLALMLNFYNRKSQINQLKQIPEQQKLAEIYNDLITIYDDYRYQKLEIQDQIDHRYQSLDEKTEKQIQSLKELVYLLGNHLQNLSSEQIELLPTIEMPESPTLLMPAPESTTSLFARSPDTVSTKDISDQNIRPFAISGDLIQLNTLLIQHNWQEGNHETSNILMKAMQKGQNSSINLQDITTINLNLLKEIDALWLKQSDRRFGFSVQLQIWEDYGGIAGVFNHEVYKNWAESVGWYHHGNGRLIEHLNKSSNAPKGQFPAIALSWTDWGAAWCGREAVALFSLLKV